MALTSHHTWKFPQQPNLGVHHAITPIRTAARSPARPRRSRRKSAEDIRDLIRYSTPGRIAAFIAEPIQGVGGATHGAPKYFAMSTTSRGSTAASASPTRCRPASAAPASTTGASRTAAWSPDIVTMAKGIGNGWPLAAVTTRREIAEAMTQRIHFNTFGGNPVSMAAGLAMLDVIDEDGIQENARVVGGHLKAGLEELQERHRLIGDVRGMGLMLGIELVRDRETKEPATQETLAVSEAMREMGVLLGKGGLYGNMLRIKPPMCITRGGRGFHAGGAGPALTQVER